jgi:hypothetical protein
MTLIPWMHWCQRSRLCIWLVNLNIHCMLIYSMYVVLLSHSSTLHCSSLQSDATHHPMHHKPVIMSDQPHGPLDICFLYLFTSHLTQWFTCNSLHHIPPTLFAYNTRWEHEWGLLFSSSSCMDLSSTMRRIPPLPAYRSEATPDGTFLTPEFGFPLPPVLSGTVFNDTGQMGWYHPGSHQSVSWSPRHMFLLPAYFPFESTVHLQFPVLHPSHLINL